MILSLACDTLLILSQEALFCYPHHFRLLYSPQHSWGIRLFIYHIDRIVKETGENFNDEAHIIYVNAQIQDETALGKLMHDFFCVNAENMKYSILAERVRYFKETKKGVVDMSSVMEELIEEGIAKGREMEKIEERNRFNRMIESLIENKVSDVQIMKSTGVTPEELDEIKKKKGFLVI